MIALSANTRLKAKPGLYLKRRPRDMRPFEAPASLSEAVTTPAPPQKSHLLAALL